MKTNNMRQLKINFPYTWIDACTLTDRLTHTSRETVQLILIASEFWTEI